MFAKAAALCSVIAVASAVALPVTSKVSLVARDKMDFLPTKNYTFLMPGTNEHAAYVADNQTIEEYSVVRQADGKYVFGTAVIPGEETTPVIVQPEVGAAVSFAQGEEDGTPFGLRYIEDPDPDRDADWAWSCYAVVLPGKNLAWTTRNTTSGDATTMSLVLQPLDLKAHQQVCFFDQ